MYSAYIKKDGEKIKVSINQFDEKYKRDHFSAFCFICNKTLSAIAISSPKTKAHFRHSPGDFCPTIIENRKKYLNLEFKDYHIYKKGKLIEEVKNNLSKIYVECKRLCNNSLFYKEFEELLKEASRKRIWEYANIEVYHIPFCLLTLQFIFNKNDDRKSNTFFSFSNQIISDYLFIDFNDDNLNLLKIEADTKEIITIYSVNEKFLENDLKNKDNFNKKRIDFEKAIH